MQSSASGSNASQMQWARKIYQSLDQPEAGILSVASMEEAADILEEWRLDPVSRAAALVYPAYISKEIEEAEIVEHLGQPAVEFLDSLEQLLQLHKKITSKPNYEHTLKNLRKFTFALSSDIRPIMIVLAIWVSLLRRIEGSSFSSQRRQSLARIGRDVYAPLADQIGVGAAKAELEDSSFRCLRPKDYYSIKQKVEQYVAGSQEYLTHLKQFLREEMTQKKIKVHKIESRSKHLYSVYKKLAKVGDIDQMFDLMALRVILEEEPDCYHALGIVHSRFEPIMERIKDYIATPKPNGYQSLHTTVTAFEERVVEIQIRTQKMHEQAEWGLAAHFHYNQHKTKAAYRGQAVPELPRKQWWLQDIANMGQLVKRDVLPRELKLDLFGGRVFVFSPGGDLYNLPQGSTVLDFAFAVHSEIGLRTWAGEVNGDLRALDHQLENGDTAEILTYKQPQANRDWLDIVATKRAKNRIRAWLRSQQREQYLKRGQRRLQEVVDKLQLEITDDRLVQLATKLNFPNLQEMLVALGEGRLSASRLRARLRPGKPNRAEPKEQSLPKNQVLVAGYNNMPYRIAGCCQPQAPMSITGFVTRGHGVTVHRQDCENIPDQPARLLSCSWQS